MFVCVQQIASLAPIGTFLVAFCALFCAIKQFKLNDQNQKETLAVQNYRDFIKLCIDKPKLALGNYPYPTPEENESYAWFVAYMVWCAERILKSEPKDNIWFNNLSYIFSEHAAYFKSSDFSIEEKLYDASVLRLISSIRGGRA
jgi:hypothetical protein